MKITSRFANRKYCSGKAAGGRTGEEERKKSNKRKKEKRAGEGTEGGRKGMRMGRFFLPTDCRLGAAALTRAFLPPWSGPCDMAEESIAHEERPGEETLKPPPVTSSGSEQSFLFLFLSFFFLSFWQLAHSLTRSVFRK